MIIFPAIDLSGGQIVRLERGDFNKKKVYSNNFFQNVKDFELAGAKWIHVVDLDAARTGKTQNYSAIKEIVDNSNCKIQLGGGIRNLSKIEKWLKMGVNRVVIGTAAVKDNSLVKEAVKEFPGMVSVGLDLKGEHVAIEGWTKTIKDNKADFYFNKFSDLGVKSIIFTDIARDGLLKGPNIKKTVYYKNMIKVPLIASGGVSTLNDMKILRDNKIYGVIIGKAIYDNKIKLQELFLKY